MGDGYRSTYLWYALLGALGSLCILGQTSSDFVPDYAELQNRFQMERKFVADIEASLPPGAMIFELPNVDFPEAKAIFGMQGYDELRGYLHSHSLRWSAGAMRGRPESEWASRNGLGSTPAHSSVTSSQPLATELQLPPHALENLVLAGFIGIYLDRHGYSDDGVAIMGQLQSLLGVAPIQSENRRLAFFSLTSFARTLRARYTTEEWQAEKRKALSLSSTNQVKG